MVELLLNHGLFDYEQFFAREAQVQKGRSVRCVGDNHLGGDIYEHALQPLRRRFNVKIGVGVATVKDPEVGDDALRALGEKDWHWPTEHLLPPQHQCGEVLRIMRDSPEVKFSGGVSHRRFFRTFRQGPSLEIVYYIDLHIYPMPRTDDRLWHYHHSIKPLPNRSDGIRH